MGLYVACALDFLYALVSTRRVDFCWFSSFPRGTGVWSSLSGFCGFLLAPCPFPIPLLSEFLSDWWFFLVLFFPDFPFLSGGVCPRNFYGVSTLEALSGVVSEFPVMSAWVCSRFTDTGGFRGFSYYSFSEGLGVFGCLPLPAHFGLTYWGFSSWLTMGLPSISPVSDMQKA